MELGEALRQARLEAGLSQRQLCEGIITRNMLSQLEHGTARPSMATLTALAGRLGKPVGFFLDGGEGTPNQKALADAWEHWNRGDVEGARQALEGFRQPDGLLEGSFFQLSCLVHLSLAEAALADHRPGKAGEYLARAAEGEGKTPCPDYLRTRRLLLQGRLNPAAWQALPSLDEVLLAKGEGALLAGEHLRCRKLLEAMEGRTSRWYLLMGKCALAENRWQEGAKLLTQAETAYPGETAPLLELAYRELGDFRRAYEYACAQRKG